MNISQSKKKKKKLHKANKPGNEKIVNYVNDVLIDLGNVVNRKGIPENENPDKVTHVIEEILNYNKPEKGEGPKALTEQMLPRLPIALPHVKAGNTYENLLNETPQIKHSLCQAKEITKRVYNKITNSKKR